MTARWTLRHAGPPSAVPGWLMLLANRHVPGPAHFDDLEAREFGLVLRHSAQLLEELTGALRIYTAALGESSPHFHAHLVPRYEMMPLGAKAWSVFDLERAVKAGEIPDEPERVAELSRRFVRALEERPLPLLETDANPRSAASLVDAANDE